MIHPKLTYAITLLADIIIEKEGAFGMRFGSLDFEARWKADNDTAYCRKSGPNWTEDEAAEALLSMREYFKEELGVQDECERA